MRMRKASKIFVLGNCRVGKTALIIKMLENRFTEEYRPTVGVVVRNGRISVDEHELTVEFWEVSGIIKDNYKSVLHYMDDADAFILIVDVTDNQSLQELPFWFHVTRITKNSTRIIPYLIILNKIDLVDDSESQIIMIKKKIDELSRKTGKYPRIIPVSVRENNLRKKIIPSLLNMKQWKKGRNINNHPPLSSQANKTKSMHEIYHD